mmetsp:Transcript_52546/g.114741  ORF Transcript_52546/g.114741 Transcript_52546/m.114741 type:complete len:530 (+) Transcript_52546:80-1669(+)
MANGDHTDLRRIPMVLDGDDDDEEDDSQDVRAIDLELPTWVPAAPSAMGGTVLDDDDDDDEQQNQQLQRTEPQLHEEEPLEVPDEDGGQCSICLMGLLNTKIEALRCGHVYHPHCLHQWRHSRGKAAVTCPQCKMPCTVAGTFAYDAVQFFDDWWDEFARVQVLPDKEIDRLEQAHFQEEQQQEAELASILEEIQSVKQEKMLAINRVKQLELGQSAREEAARKAQAAYSELRRQNICLEQAKQEILATTKDRIFRLRKHFGERSDGRDLQRALEVARLEKPIEEDSDELRSLRSTITKSRFKSYANNMHDKIVRKYDQLRQSMKALEEANLKIANIRRELEQAKQELADIRERERQSKEELRKKKLHREFEDPFAAATSNLPGSESASKRRLLTRQDSGAMPSSQKSSKSPSSTEALTVSQGAAWLTPTAALSQRNAVSTAATTTTTSTTTATMTTSAAATTVPTASAAKMKGKASVQPPPTPMSQAVEETSICRIRGKPKKSNLAGLLGAGAAAPAPRQLKDSLAEC